MNIVNAYNKNTKETFVVLSVNDDDTITLSTGKILSNIEIKSEWILL